MSISAVGACQTTSSVFSSFDTLSFHVIFIISLRCCIIYAFNLFTCVLYTVHVSASKKRSRKGNRFVQLVFHPQRHMMVVPQHLSQLSISCACLPIQKVSSLSSLALPVMVLPRYTIFFVCLSASS